MNSEIKNESTGVGFSKSTEKESSKLDLLRTFAVLLVVISHLPITYELFGSSRYVTASLGLVGVGMFFVHTCLVLMMSLERLSLKEGSRRRGVKFLIRRMFRIYPLSISTVLLLAAIAYFNAGELDIPTTISNLLLVQNITGHDSIPAPLWSLPYEVQMYLALPLIYIAIEKVGHLSLYFLFFLYMVSIGLVLCAWAAGLNYHLIKYVPCFLPGIMAYVLLGKATAIKPWLFFSLIGVAALIFPWMVGLGVKENLLIWPVCLAIGMILPFVDEVKSLLASNIGKQIAKYSYCIYLIHGPWIVFSFYYIDGVGISMRWCIFFFGTAVLSYLSFHLIERPLIKIGVRLSNFLTIAKSREMGALK